MRKKNQADLRQKRSEKQKSNNDTDSVDNTKKY